jgi:outer membrane lipoprotein
MRGALLITASLVTLFLLGCAPKIPHDVARQVTWQGEFADLQANPENYEDEFVLLGGRIVRTENYRDHSEITVVQHPLDQSNRPLPDRDSGGRFLVRSDTFIDPEVYSPGRFITVAGKVTGSETRSIGNYPYVHPIVEGELYAWEPRADRSPRFHFGIGVGRTF